MAKRSRRRGPTRQGIRTATRKVTTARRKARTSTDKLADALVAHHRADQKLTKAVKTLQTKKTSAHKAEVSRTKRKCRCGKSHSGRR